MEEPEKNGISCSMRKNPEITSSSVNPRTARAREALAAAAFELVSQKPVSQISLTEIAEKAGVSRPTVYKLFSDTPTLVAQVTCSSLDQILSKIDENLKAEDDKAYFRSLMYSFVAEVYKHRDFYRNAIYGPSAAQIMISVTKMLDVRMKEHRIGKRLAAYEDDGDDIRGIISAGVVCLLIRWLGSEFKGKNSPTSIAERIADSMYQISDAL